MDEPPKLPTLRASTNRRERWYIQWPEGLKGKEQLKKALQHLVSEALKLPYTKPHAEIREIRCIPGRGYMYFSDTVVGGNIVIYDDMTTRRNDSYHSPVSLAMVAGRALNWLEEQG